MSEQRKAVEDGPLELQGQGSKLRPNGPQGLPRALQATLPTSTAAAKHRLGVGGPSAVLMVRQSDLKGQIAARIPSAEDQGQRKTCTLTWFLLAPRQLAKSRGELQGRWESLSWGKTDSANDVVPQRWETSVPLVLERCQRLLGENLPHVASDAVDGESAALCRGPVRSAAIGPPLQGLFCDEVPTQSPEHLVRHW